MFGIRLGNWTATNQIYVLILKHSFQGKACWANIYFSDFSTGFNEPTPILALKSPQYTKHVMGNNFSRSARLVGKTYYTSVGPKVFQVLDGMSACSILDEYIV